MFTEAEQAYLLALAKKAGEAVMDLYNQRSAVSVKYKKDASPLTAADRASHLILVSGLHAAYPAIPVISEEDDTLMAWDTRRNLDSFWLVDPLDGTKEFLNRSGDFTVNIALISRGEPCWGIVYAPARGWLYYGGPESGAWKRYSQGVPISLPMLQQRSAGETIAVRSKSHSHPDEEMVLREQGVTKTVSIGSSLKFCLVAEGAADLYYRKGPTWEWDTAAAHAVALGAGAVVMEHDGSDGIPLTYNKKSLKNDYGFICKRD